MGTNAALITCQVIENSFEVMAIHMFTLIQAVDYLKIEGRLSTVTKGIYMNLRALVPVFREDRMMSPEILKIRDFLLNNSLISGS
jgi:histidine ammonia-lyase